MTREFSSISDDDLQRLYWSMPLDSDEAVEANRRIAIELARRNISVEIVLDGVERDL